MSIEFKNNRFGRNRKSRLFKKTRRAAMNKIDATHLPMRVQTGKNGYYGQGTEYKAHFPLYKLRKFLKVRVGKPIDKVFSEFLVEARKFSQKEDLKDIFYSCIDSDERLLKLGYSNCFYVSNSILNYKKSKSFKKSVPKKFIWYNNNHWDNSILDTFKPLNNTGPDSIGKFWVDVNGQYMLLPVYAVFCDKWKYSREECDDYSVELFTKKRTKSYKHLKDFTRCIVIGKGGCLTVYKPCVDWDGTPLIKPCSFLYIIRTSDIENYKK